MHQRGMSYQDQDQRGLGEGPRDRGLVTKNLWETLEREGRFARFLAAARAAELENNLRGPGFMTVFAVPDDALGNESDDALREIVSYHVVHGMQKEIDLRTAKTVRTFAGQTIPVAVEGGHGRFGEAKIVRADIACTNGMIQVIEKLVRAPSHA